MAKPLHPESVEACALRLRWTREAMELSQAEMARRAGIAAATWNNAETGDNKLGLENALKLCQTYRLTLDWLYRGIINDLPAALAKGIEEQMAKEASTIE
jgi:transcriptional regulator with XRE-family HTH domain